ncbi:MAG: hypothetical protein MJE77_24950 [Proteobacteria bacterium]|nr:hypothetical protein [Pseudomonadota bacterium]
MGLAALSTARAMEAFGRGCPEIAAAANWPARSMSRPATTIGDASLRTSPRTTRAPTYP